jgi:hypothetical protein
MLHIKIGFLLERLDYLILVLGEVTPMSQTKIGSKREVIYL